MKSFAIAALAGFVAATPISEIEAKFINYVATYGKTYATTEEYAMRLELFTEWDRQIEEFNRVEQHSRHGHNKFSDRTEFERAQLSGALNAPELYGEDHTPVNATPDWTTGVNWTAAGDVSPVKDQGQCGSCWAFSSTGAVESAYHMAYNKTGAVAQFSEQQLVDCVKSCYGCNGGWPGHSFYYYQSHGPYYENDWPYTATDGTCTYSSTMATNIRVATYTKVTRDSYTALQSAIALQPVSILIAAATSYFQSY